MVAMHANPNQAAAVTWLNGLGITFPVVQANYAMYNSYATGTTLVPQLYIITRNQVIHYSNLGAEGEAAIEGHILDAIYLRDPIDLEMIMDVSDSMNDAPTGGDSKLAMMKQSSKMILDFLHDHGQTSDRSGLVWFTDNASEYTNLSSQKLIPVIPNTADLKSQIDSHGTGICTAMGAGLQTAFNTLAADGTQKRFAILLTDGMQNIEPKVTKVGTHYEITDSGGWLCGSHSSTPANPGIDISTYNTAVHTIGVGITATYSALLQDLANEMGGIYLGTNDPATDLNLIYFVDLCNCMAGGSPAIVHHHAGIFSPGHCQVIEKFSLNRSVRKFTAMLSWEKTLSGSLAFWLRAPDGTLLDLYNEIKTFDSYAMVTVYLPAEYDGKKLPSAGEWQMVVHGETDGPAAFCSIVVAEDTKTHFALKIPEKIYEVGDIVPLRIRIKDEKNYVVNPSEILLEKSTLRTPVAEMLAQYKVSTYQLKERMGLRSKQFDPDPISLKLKMLSLDPRFKKQLLPARTITSLKEGSLEFRIIENEIIVPVLLKDPGLNTFRIHVMIDSKENGPISRVTMASVQVSPGKADPGRTKVQLVPRSKKTIKGAILYVTPRNAHGHLLGPGIADEMGIILGKEKIQCTVHDLLDGSYQVEFDHAKTIPAKGQPVMLTIQGKKIWDGLIK
jgi:hypothetical protein